MRILRETGLLFIRRTKETLRQPVWLFMGLITPILYLALFSPLLKGIGYPPLSMAEVLNNFVPGLLALIAFSTGMSAGWPIIEELQYGVIERLRVTPASRFSIMIGSVLSSIVSFTVPAIVVVFTASLLGFEVHYAGLAILFVLLFLLTMVVSAWSASVALILKEIESLAAVLNGLQLPLTLLSGVLLPLSAGPEWIRVIAHINPLYYAVEASRQLASGVFYSTEVFTAFVIMIPLTAIVLAWATNVYRKAIS